MPLLRTILRRSFFTAAALSTLLLLATLILWPVSHYRYVEAACKGEGETLTIIDSASGRVRMRYVCTGNAWEGVEPPRGWSLRVGIPSGAPWSYLTWNTPDTDESSIINAPTFLGVCWFHLAPSFGITDNRVLIPFSYLTLLFSILPFLAFRSLRRRRKAARRGLCPKCSYDLRAHATGSLCPECGTKI